MSLNIKIVDRKNETESIISYFNNNIEDKKSSAVFIWSDTGIGKSTIVSKIKTSGLLRKKIVIVNTHPVNSTETSIEGLYLSLIADALNQEFLSDYSIGYFLEHDSQIYRERKIEHFIDSGLNKEALVLALLKAPFQNALLSERLLYNLDSDSVLILKEYISNTIKFFNPIIDICNVQNIDTTSWRVISGFFDEISCVNFLFEYTTSNTEQTSVEKLATSLPVEAKLIKIDELPFEFALSLIKTEYTKENIQEIEKLYEDIIKGNLYKLIQYSPNIKGDPLKHIIKSINYNTKLILAIICLHEGSIYEEVLNEIISFITPSFFIPEHWKKDLSSLIEVQNHVVYLKHASIIETFEISKENHAVLTAYSYLESFYRAKIKVEDSTTSNNAIIQLFKLYTMLDIEKLPVFMEEFRKIIVSNISEAKAINIIKKTHEAASEKDNYMAKILLIKLCYETGLYSGALEMMKQLEPLNSDSEYMFMAMLLNRNDYHEKTINLCNERIGKTKSERAKLIFLLIRMLSERSLNQTWRYKKTFWTTYFTFSFKKYLEYGFLLRNSQIVFSYKKSIPYLEKSIEFFNQKNCPKFAIYTKLTLLIQNARLGYFINTEEELDDISNTILNESFEKHIIYVNKAALKILQGRTGLDTKKLLDKALLTVTTTFDRVVVLNNLLCCHIENNSNITIFERTKKQLIKYLTEEPDKRLHKKTYTNFYLYYKYVQMDTQQANYWKKKAINVRISSKEMIEEILLGQKKASSNLKYLASKKYCISFITYWHFQLPIDYETDIEHC